MDSTRTIYQKSIGFGKEEWKFGRQAATRLHTHDNRVNWRSDAPGTCAILREKSRLRLGKCCTGTQCGRRKRSTLGLQFWSRVTCDWSQTDWTMAYQTGIS